MSDGLSYAKAGIDIDVTDKAKRDMAGRMDGRDARVLNRTGAFASLLEGRFAGYREPVLVMKTEEPGSKQKLAFQLGRVRGIAFDLINHLVNDLMVTGAEPLYVQDCIICGKIEPDVVTELVGAMADACREQGCVLCGGETSVQPGVAADGVYILTACAVGVVEKDFILDGSSASEGDVVLGAASNGPHTNGYTLVRKLLEKNPGLGDAGLSDGRFMDVLMRPHTCYYRAAKGIFRAPGLRGMAHITGGGIQDNLNRILPRNLDAEIDLGRIRVPEIFQVIRREGAVAEAEMLRTFNMGVGLTIVCAETAAEEISKQFESQGHSCYPIGKTVKGSQKVRFTGRLKPS
jgi:phosphoribosylformylglycinamidine cyclo-ligase